jgi:hypothetical protein
MRFKFESRTFRLFVPLSLYRVDNRVCMSHGVQVAGASWWTAMRIMARVGDLVQRIGDGHTGRVPSGRTIMRSGDDVCSLHPACGDEECGFLG